MPRCKVIRPYNQVWNGFSHHRTPIDTNTLKLKRFPPYPRSPFFRSRHSVLLSTTQTSLRLMDTPLWPLLFLFLLPFFMSLWSSVPAPRAVKNLKYFIFPLASNQFQTPPFPAPPPLSFSPSLWGYRPKPHTHTHRNGVRMTERATLRVSSFAFFSIA